MCAGGRFALRQSQAIRPGGRFQQISAHAGTGPRRTGSLGRGFSLRALAAGYVSGGFSYIRGGGGFERSPRRPLAPRTFSRRHYRGAETFRNCAAALCLFWTQRRAAGTPDPPDVRGPESRYQRGGLPDRARRGWPGAFFAEWISEGRGSDRKSTRL